MEDGTPPTQIVSSPNKPFSRIILPVSPAAVSSQKNMTGLARVAKDLAADVYNYIQQWNDSHIVGVTIVKNITYIKCANLNVYTVELEKLTTELRTVVEKLKSVSNALGLLIFKMENVVKLHKMSKPLFFSLDGSELLALVQSIGEAYKLEMKMKEEVLENIAHCKNKTDVMFYAVSWTHQPYITNNVNVKLETLLVETGHRQIV